MWCIISKNMKWQDAKKSPLALLAMTCSNIGADIIGSHVKPMSAYDNPHSKTSSVNHNNSSSSTSSITHHKSRSRSSAELIDSEKIDTNSNSPRDTTSSSQLLLTSHNNNHHHNSRSPSASSSGGSVASGPTSSSSASAQVNQHNNNQTSGTPVSNSCHISFKPYEIQSNNSSKSSNSSSQPSLRSPNHSHHHHKSDRSNHHQVISPSSKNNSKIKSDLNGVEVSPSGASHRYSSASSEPKVVSSSATSCHPISSSSSSSSPSSNRQSSTASGLDSSVSTDAILRSVNPSHAAYAAAVMSQTAAAAHHHQQHQHLMAASKAAAAAASSVCRDPFCTGCHLSSAAASMFPGLPQVTGSGSGGVASHNFNPHHAAALNSLMSPHVGPHVTHSPFSPGGYPVSPFTSQLAAAAAAAAAAHNFSGGLNGTSSSSTTGGNNSNGNKSFVCSWAANGSFCGKSFNTGDELLQHLKNHTSNFAAAAAAFGSNGSTSGSGSSSSSSPFGQYRPHPLMDPASAAALLSSQAAAGLRRAAFDLSYSRFHPYGTSSNGSSSAKHSAVGGMAPYGLNPLASGLFNHHNHNPHHLNHLNHHPSATGLTSNPNSLASPGLLPNGWRPTDVPHSLRWFIMYQQQLSYYYYYYIMSRKEEWKEQQEFSSSSSSAADNN